MVPKARLEIKHPFCTLLHPLWDALWIPQATQKSPKWHRNRTKNDTKEHIENNVEHILKKLPKRSQKGTLLDICLIKKGTKTEKGDYHGTLVIVRLETMISRGGAARETSKNLSGSTFFRTPRKQ